MKKLFLGAILAVTFTGVAFADAEIQSNFADIEANYNELKAEEATLLEQRKAEAAEAEKTLEEQRRVYAELKQREARLIDGKKTKYYKKEYRDLAKQYGGMRKELEGEMAAQQEIIDAYRMMAQ